jgi:hypothetical protein
MPIISRTSGGEIIAASTFIVDHNSKSKEKSSIVPWSFFFGVQVKNPKPFIRDPSFTNLLDALDLRFLRIIFKIFVEKEIFSVFYADFTIKAASSGSVNS